MVSSRNCVLAVLLMVKITNADSLENKCESFFYKNGLHNHMALALELCGGSVVTKMKFRLELTCARCARNGNRNCFVNAKKNITSVLNMHAVNGKCKNTVTEFFEDIVNTVRRKQAG